MLIDKAPPTNRIEGGAFFIPTTHHPPRFFLLLLLTLTPNAACSRNQNGKSEIPISKSQTNSKSKIRKSKNLRCRQNGRGRAPSRFSPAACHCVLRFPFLPSSLLPFLPLFCASNFGFCSKHARTVRTSYTRKLYSYSLPASRKTQNHRPPPTARLDVNRQPTLVGKRRFSRSKGENGAENWDES